MIILFFLLFLFIFNYKIKSFDGLKTFKFAPPKIKDDIPKEAISMTSKDGENIEFSTPLKCEGPVESWLNDAE